MNSLQTIDALKKLIAKMTGQTVEEIEADIIPQAIDQITAAYNGGSGGGDSGKISEFAKFRDNSDVDYAYDANTGANYTVIRVYKDKLDGTKQYPFVRYNNMKSSLELAEEEGWFLVLTGGLYNPNSSNHVPDGVVIENGEIIQNDIHQIHYNSYPLLIDANGNLSYAQPDETGEDILTGHNNIVSAVGGWQPIIIDYQPVNQLSPLLGWSVNAQRNIIGQFGNGDYAIVTCEGRNFNNSEGWTMPEAISICRKIGLKFAYNLDGGGSVETVIGKKQLNLIYENEKGRKLSTFIVFNGKTSFNDTPIVKRLIKLSVNPSEQSVDIHGSISKNSYTVKAHYSDGSSKTLNANEGARDLSGVDFNRVGDYYAVFTYTENGITKTVTSLIHVIEPGVITLSNITATKTVKSYLVGDTLDTSDITVIANYSNNTTSDVTSSAVIDTSNVDMAIEGTYLIGVSYTENDVTKTTSISITVSSDMTKDYTFIKGYSIAGNNDGSLIANASSDNKRLTALVQTPNDAQIKDGSNNVLGYLIPIPNDATSVTVTTPDYINGIIVWDSNKIRKINNGWSATSVNTESFIAGENAYISVNVKNTTNTAISNDVDTSEWTIEFN